MEIKAKFLKFLNKWSACTTYKGYDYFELGNSEIEAISKLKIRLYA